MKILLSAFECEPDRGSEFEVGWQWAVCLTAVGHDVTVLTQSYSRAAIEQALLHLGRRTNLRFVYFDLPRPLRWRKRGPLHIHHILWQWRAAHFAKRLHDVNRFDRVHHVTYAGLRSPSFMGNLGIPFIFGPVGGGEVTPLRLRAGMSARGLLFEFLRDIANFGVRLEPLLRRTFSQAEHVYVTSRETAQLLPRSYSSKTTVELAIGTDISEPRTPLPGATEKRPLRVLYAGRMESYKGMHLGLPAFAKLLTEYPEARLTMVGAGSQEKLWRKLADRLGISPSVDWLPWQPHRAVAEIICRHDLLLFPSLHDSGGLIVLEAMREGLPVICLRLGGPGTMVTDECGRALEVHGKGRRQIVADLGSALIELARSEVRAPLAVGARKRCEHFSWHEKVERLYGAAA